MATDTVKEGQHIADLKADILQAIEEQNASARIKAEAEIRNAEAQEEANAIKTRELELHEKQIQEITTLIEEVRHASLRTIDLHDVIMRGESPILALVREYFALLMQHQEYLRVIAEYQKIILTKIIAGDDSKGESELLQKASELVQLVNGLQQKTAQKAGEFMQGGVNITFGPKIGKVKADKSVGISDGGDVDIS